jgi:hypothetical protein
MTGDVATFIFCMQKLLLVRNSFTCTVCGEQCELEPRDDGYSWMCPAFNCNTTVVTVYIDSYFYGKQYPWKAIDFAFMDLSLGAPVGKMREVLGGLAKSTGTDLNMWLQELCGTMLLHINTRLTGEVDIDGTYTGGEGSQKLGWGGGTHRGALRYKKQGFIVVQERKVSRKGVGNKNGRRMQVASTGANENQKDADLAALNFIDPGSTVFSDAGVAFAHMAHVVGGDHFTVNHSKFFKDPETGVHSNPVESRNRQLKDWMSKRARNATGTDKTLWNNMAQYVWEQWYSDGSGTMKFSMFILAFFDQHGFLPRP